MTVPYSLSGTATNVTDYTITNQPVTIPAGQTSTTITITIVPDSMYEFDEDVVVTMGEPTNAVKGALTVHTATIRDDDPMPTVSFNDSGQWSAAESSSMSFKAVLSAVSGADVTVPYSVSGTATNGADYTITSQPVTIPAGQTSATITITILSDSIVEGNETVVVTMETPTYATPAWPTVHTATIRDDDVSQSPVMSNEISLSQFCDTVLKDLWGSPNPASVGQNVRLTYTVSNQGSVVVGGLRFQVVENGQVLATQTVGTLAAGKSRSLTLKLKVSSTAAKGDHILTGEVLPVTGETNMDNNKATVKVTVR
ncbi:MAG: Polymorphic membrane protein [uncultured bacterium]|nr:MAG: Polymorphic membrane protein [uncultured bacterium]